MHRIFGLMALAAAAYGVWVLFSAPEADTLARAASEGSGAYRTWAFGLVTGLFLAALWMIDWRDLPARMSTWAAVQRRRLGLILIGGLCAGVLLLF